MLDLSSSLMDFWGRPRAQLVYGPTPLVPAANLGAAIGCPGLVVKRDDLTGGAIGGNKYRQLEFYLGEALTKGATCMVGTGSIQSNFVCAAAAAAASHGLKFAAQIETRVDNSGEEYMLSGNSLLLKLFSPIRVQVLEIGDDETEADTGLLRLAEDLNSEGEIAYPITMAPERNPVGALGYVVAAMEYAAQCEESGLHPDLIAVGSGSGLTHIGLLIGLRYLGLRTRVVGFCVRRDAASQRARLHRLLTRLGEMLGDKVKVLESDIEVSDSGFVGGYGVPDPATIEAIRLAASTEGLLVDPVYSGRVLSGLIKDLHTNALGSEENIVFWHTGGSAGLFAYRGEFENDLAGG